MSIYTQMHDKYGAPTHVAEFRLFMLNDCYKSCENCFYHRSGNHLSNYSEIAIFADEVRGHGYQLETCYLLPTDFFENKANFELLKKKEIQNIVSKFLYMGIASTLEGEPNFDDFKLLIDEIGVNEVELQINLVNEKLFEEDYFQELKHNIEKLRFLLEKKVVFNLALNLGRKISRIEYLRVKKLVKELSDDGILEINFTFLYNQKIPKKNKTEKLIESLSTMNTLSEMYNKVETKYNDRTILRKPAFIFKDNKTYIAPIIPFDEYVYSEDDEYKMSDNSFESFLSSINKIQKINNPIINECYSCANLDVCMGKAYFAAAHTYNLPCYLGV